jgi:hypothetical protein
VNGRDRCLVLRPGALGDAIVSLPAFELLRREFPELSMTLASSPAGCRVGQLSGIFAETKPYESPDLTALFVDGLDRDGLFEDLRALVAFGAGGAGEIAERARDAGVPVTASVDTWPEPSGGHVCQQLLERTAEALGADLLGEPLEIPGRPPPGAGDFSSPEGLPALPPLRVTPDEHVWAQRPGRRVAVAPGSGSAEKCWPAANFAAACRLLCARRPVHLMLVLGPAEMERPELRGAFRGLDCTVSECWSVPDLAATFAACDLYVGNDSGLSHLAAWADAPVLALFGPTDPETWAPVGDVSVLGMAGLSPAGLAEAADEALDWSAGRPGGR